MVKLVPVSAVLGVYIIKVRFHITINLRIKVVSGGISDVLVLFSNEMLMVPLN